MIQIKGFFYLNFFFPLFHLMQSDLGSKKKFVLPFAFVLICSFLIQSLDLWRKYNIFQWIWRKYNNFFKENRKNIVRCISKDFFKFTTFWRLTKQFSLM